MKVLVTNIDPKIRGQKKLKVGETYETTEVHWRCHALMSVGIKIGKQTIALWADQLLIV